MKRLKYFAVLLMTVAFAANLQAQQIGTLYFMKNVPERSDYNPAFQPIHNVWIDLPVLPNLRLDAGVNALKFSDIIKHDGNGNTYTFLHPNASVDDFYNSLRRNTRINADFTFNLVGFGFRVKEKNYFTFGIAEKFSINMYLPKDLFKFALYGTGDSYQDNFNLKRLGVNATAYMEYSLGYSRIINDRLTVGGKLKYLAGQANISTNFKKFDLSAGVDEWSLDGEGSLNASIPVAKVTIPEQQDGTIDAENISVDTDNFGDNLTKDILGIVFPKNWGLGLDLGATYNILPNLQLSAAVTDLGFIRWSKTNAINASVNGKSAFTGVQYRAEDGYDIGEEFSNIGTDFLDAFKVSSSQKAYTTYLHTRVNLGAEYSLWKDRIGFGLLSSTLFAGKTLYEDLTLSANFRPVDWFSTTVSYSFLNGRAQTIGFGAQLQFFPFNMYIALDNIPLSYAKSNNALIPNTSGVNLQMGWVMVFGNPRKVGDKDKDGVKNRKDKCPDTPLGYQVDKKGCTVDSDADGVADNMDKCPDTPAGVQVDSIGCPIDTDGDGVADYLDKCPETPEAAYGKVDSIGCPSDTDGDGVADYLDKCPNTPQGIQVGSDGCPLDSDNDGVLDKNDKCPNTPQGVQVDENGCPRDEDADGVADNQDKCPGTPAAARGKVSTDGCPLDTDGDGIADYEDNCPTVQGVKSNQGCPEVKAAVKKIFERALNGIEFESGKDVIKSSSNSILNQIASVMKDNPTYQLIINGHTDNTGNPEMNQQLSEKRAAAVKNYLVKKGIEENRMTTAGYGDTKPVADNKTAAGRTKNRRVEFIVKFEDTVPAE